MMRRAVLVSIILLLSARIGAAQGNGKPAIPPELPPFPCTNAQAERFRDEANSFLREYRDSGHAPTVLHNLVMLERIGGDEYRIRAAQFRLVMTYPKSLPTAHFVATCKDADEYRKVVRHGVQEFSSWLTSKKSAGAFNHALELGMMRFGGPKEFLKDEKFKIEAVVSASVAENQTAVRNFARFVQKEGKLTTRQIVQIFLDGSMSDAQKLVALSGHFDADAPTAVCHEALWDRLSKTEQAELEPLRARLDHLCRNGEIMSARSLLKECDFDDPQILYWRVWTSLILGGDGEAATPLATLKEAHVDSKWTRHADELMRRAANLAKTAREQAELWEKAATKLRSTTSGLEATVQLGGDGKTFKPSGYLAIAPTEPLFEVQLRDATETIIAFEATAKGTKLYTSGDNERLELPAASAFPVIRWSDSKSMRPFNKQEVGLRFDMATGEAFAAAASKFADLPYLRSKESISATLGSALSAGYVPCPIVRRGTLQTVTWVRPDARTGELTEWSFDFDDEARLRALRGPSFRIDDICYAGEANWRTKRPAWPEAPVKRAESFDAATFAKLMGALAKVYETLSPKEDEKEEVAGERRAVK